MPAREIPPLRVFGKPGAIAGRNCRVAQLEAEKVEAELVDHRRNPRQREPMLLDVKHQVPAAAHAEEILGSLQPRDHVVVAACPDPPPPPAARKRTRLNSTH